MGVELPEHTSASQLNTYASCPRKYSLRYLEKTPPEDRSPSLVLGSVVHSAIGWFFEAKITGESPAPVDAAELARADFAAEGDGRDDTLGALDARRPARPRHASRQLLPRAAR